MVNCSLGRSVTSGSECHILCLLSWPTEHLQCLQTPEVCRALLHLFSLLAFMQSMSFFLSELIFNVFF